MTPEHHAEAILRAAEPTAWLYRNSLGHACVQFVQGLMGDGWTETPLYTAEAILAAVREAVEAKWQSIESVPDVPGKYFFCRLAWGPDSDKCTGDGFRWNGQWFAAALFYKGARHDECQNEMRQIEVTPTHWMPHCDFPLPTPPRGE